MKFISTLNDRTVGIMFRKAICLCGMLFLVHGTPSQSLEDTAVVVGQDTTLTCQTDNPDSVEWRFIPTNSNSFDIISRGKIIFNGRFHVVPNTTTGQSNLSISRVQLNDAGTYTCDDIRLRQKAELVVFDRYPSNEFCTTTSTANDNQNSCDLKSVTMSCEMSYRGNLNLTLDWFEEERWIRSESTNISGLITSSIQLHDDQIQTAKYTCRVRYLTFRSRFAWSSDVNATPIAATNFLSSEGCDLQTVECSVEKRPGCEYKWMDENGSKLSDSWSMEMSGKPNGNYTCLATCNLHSTVCSYVARILNYSCHDQISTDESPSTTSHSQGTTVEHSPQQPLKLSSGITSPETYIPITVVAVAILLVILLVVLFFRRSHFVRSERVNNVRHMNDAEVGQCNDALESTQLNGTKSKETDVMLEELSSS